MGPKREHFNINLQFSTFTPLINKSCTIQVICVQNCEVAEQLLVFYKQRLVFLSVPKTGTTAYQAALAPFADLAITDPPALKHAPLYRYNRFIRPMYERVCGVDLEILAVVREPISWLGSWYRYRQRPFLAGKPNSTAGKNFDEFVRAYTMDKRPAYADVGSQSTFLKAPEGGAAVKYLFRYDDQVSLQRFLSDRLEQSFTLQQKNVSRKAPLDLTAETEQRLRDRNAADFDLYSNI